MSRRLRIVWLLLVVVSTVGCDQATKHLARTRLDQFDVVMLLGGLGELRLAENPGAFLSLGDSLPPVARTLVFTIGAGIGLLAMFVYLLIRPHLAWLTFTGFSLALAGGIGNLIDRILRQGLVTDFLTLHCGPFHTGVFNVADVLVLIGMALLILAYWKHRTDSAGSANESHEPPPNSVH